MKKILLLVATIATTLTMNAQHVTPLEVNMVEVNLEQMRADNQGDKTAYLVQLQKLEMDLNGNEETLKAARKKFNEEKDYAKCIGDYIKHANKLLKTYDKNCKEEISDLENMQQTIDKQSAATRKLTLVSHESKPKFLNHMAEERNQISSELKILNDKLLMIAKQMSQIINIQNGLNIYNAEITSKDTDLSQKEATLKANQDAVKQEIKNIKAELKKK